MIWHSAAVQAEGIAAADSDHNIVVVAPLIKQTFEVRRKKKVIKNKRLENMKKIKSTLGMDLPNEIRKSFFS